MDEFDFLYLVNLVLWPEELLRFQQEVGEIYDPQRLADAATSFQHGLQADALRSFRLNTAAIRDEGAVRNLYLSHAIARHQQCLVNELGSAKMGRGAALYRRILAHLSATQRSAAQIAMKSGLSMTIVVHILELALANGAAASYSCGRTRYFSATNIHGTAAS